MVQPFLAVDSGPEGHPDWFDIDIARQHVVFGGWAVDRLARRAASRVVVHLDGVPIATVEEFEPRPDVHASEPDVRPMRCAFSVTIPVELLLDPDRQTLVVEAVSARGIRSLLYAGSLPGLRLRVLQLRQGEL